MRKLVIVYGAASNEEKQFCLQIIEELGQNNISIVRVEHDDPQPALRHTLEALRPYVANYNDVLVIYSGANLYLFPDNMPCDKLDIAKSRSKIVEIVDGYKTPRDREVVQNIFTAIVLRLLDAKPIKNLQEITMNKN
jgi:hypothetical protein